MITPSEFLQDCAKLPTYKTYRSALNQYLSLTLNTPINKENLDFSWEHYLKTRHNVMEDLVNFPKKCKTLARPLSPKTVNLYLQITLMYLKECGVSIDETQTRRLKKTRPKNRAVSREAELDRTVIRKILSHADTRQRAEILIAVSSGMRIGEILGITATDLNLAAVPAEIYIPATIAKNDTARTVFISREAKNALEGWLAVRDTELRRKKSRNSVPDTRIFPYSAANEIARFNALLRQSGTYSADPQTRRAQIHYHSFRKFFLTEFKLAAAAEVAEELAGHTGYLSQSYRRLSRQTMRGEYLKAEQALTMSEQFTGRAGCLRNSYRTSNHLETEVRKLWTEVEKLHAMCEAKLYQIQEK